MYYPKSQIKTNIYTNGEELQLPNGKVYTGFYWQNSQGEFYSGKNPDVKPSNRLTPISAPPTDGLLENTIIIYTYDNVDGPPFPPGIDFDQIFPENVQSYLKSKNENLEIKIKKIPTYYYPQVTSEDYNLGSFTRYLAKKANQNLYIEINKSQYDSLFNKEDNWDYPSYTIFTLTWTLTGPSPEEVSNINKMVVATTERQQQVRGLLSYFKNYSQFYRA